MPKGDGQGLHDRRGNSSIQDPAEVIAYRGQLQGTVDESSSHGHVLPSMRSGFFFLGAATLALLVSAPASAQSTEKLSYQAPPGEVGPVAVDQSGNGNDGVLKGGVTRDNGVYKFHPLSRDHKYDRIRAPDDPSLSPGSEPFTYSVKLKVSPKAEWSHTEMAVLRHGDSDTPGGSYKLELKKNRDTGRVTADCVMHDNDGAGVGYIRGRGGLPSIADGHWHTVACGRVDHSTVSLTVGHVTRTNQTHGDLGDVVGQASLLIGCQMTADRLHHREQFVGKMDNITITVQ